MAAAVNSRTTNILRSLALLVPALSNAGASERK
jgi:hypothetical protein